MKPFALNLLRLTLAAGVAALWVYYETSFARANNTGTCACGTLHINLDCPPSPSTLGPREVIRYVVDTSGGRQ